jgi:hypothetical protein
MVVYNHLEPMMSVTMQRTTSSPAKDTLESDDETQSDPEYDAILEQGRHLPANDTLDLGDETESDPEYDALSTSNLANETLDLDDETIIPDSQPEGELLGAASP